LNLIDNNIDLLKDLEVLQQNNDLLKRLNERERKARKQAEAIIEEKSLELYNKNLELLNLNTELEDIVDVRTSQLLQYTAELKKKNDELNRFSFIVSHDLKSPLRAIRNLSIWIEEDFEGVFSSDIQNHLTLLKGRVSRMEALIDGVLEYSNANKIKYEEVEVELNELIKETIVLNNIAPKVSILINVDDLTFKTKKIKLEQILFNLINNAVKFNNQDFPKLTIQAVKKEHEIEISVSDNGPGIAEEFHETIFEIFRTLHSRDSLETVGIGLSIVKKFVEEEGGKIWITSKLGEGSAFYFTWPIESNA